MKKMATFCLFNKGGDVINMFKFWGRIFGRRPARSTAGSTRFAKFMLELRYMSYLLILTFFVIKPLVIAGYDTPTGSMEPTIMTNTRYFALPSAYGGFISFTKIKLPGFKKINRGDIVIFKYPYDETQNYVKRVIGLPGDRIEIRDKTVFVNGVVLNEPYTRYRENYPRPDYGPVTVTQGHLLVLGDNRDESCDSRYWGFLPVDNVFGTPLFTFWSYDLQKHQIRFKEIFKILK
jgi:signal peptidase I